MKTRILFVCLGNICRSPTAEAVMQQRLVARQLCERIELDSAGTGDWHVGERADPRMRKHAGDRGYDLTSIARQVAAPEDFDRFDYIIAMDDTNYEDLLKLARHDADRARLHRMVSFCTRHQVPVVPDPYFGGAAGFEQVIDILEDACDGLLARVASDRTG
jgi:protein-tyrosine phosphatase